MEKHSYILVTAVRNEARHIEQTLNSVARQAISPRIWSICINDSTDETRSIVERYARKFSFIRTLEMQFGHRRGFANQALAIEAAFAQAQAIPSEYCGILDGDVTFGPEYYAELMKKLSGAPRLGIAAGRHVEHYFDGSTKILRIPQFLVMGANQFFRRRCYEEIGGHRALAWGGQDTLACVMAQLKGWKTKTFDDLEYHHHRQMGLEGTSALRARFIEGIRDQGMGMHPAYAVAKVVNRSAHRPFLLGTLSWLIGYSRGFGLAKDINIPSECREFLRSMQLRRLQSSVASMFTTGQRGL